jgi:hypothetical protein
MFELWQQLKGDGLYNKSFEEFQQRFSAPEAQTKLYDKMKSDGLYSKSPEEFQNRFFSTDPEVEAAKEKQQSFLKDESFSVTDQDKTAITEEAEKIFTAKKQEPIQVSHPFGTVSHVEDYEQADLYNLQQEYLKKAGGDLNAAKQSYIEDQEAGLQNKKVQEWAEENVSSWSDVKKWTLGMLGMGPYAGEVIEEDAATKVLEEQAGAARTIKADQKAKIDQVQNAGNQLYTEIESIDKQLEALSTTAPQNEEAFNYRQNKYQDLISKRNALAGEYKDIYDATLTELAKYEDNEKLLDIVKRSYKMTDQPKAFAAATGELLAGAMDIPEWITVSATSLITGQDPRISRAIARASSMPGMASPSALSIGADKIKEFADEVRGSLRKPQEIGDIKSIEDFAFWASDLTFNQLPQVGLMLLAPELALPSLAASAAGGKYRSMMDEMGMGAADYKPWQIFTAPIIVGGAEYLSEKISLGQLKGVRSVFAAKNNVKEAAQKYIQENIVSGKYFKDMAGEGLSEVGATMAENATDMFLLGKKDVNIWDNVPNAFASGAFMSGVLFKAPVLGAKLLSPFSNKDDMKKLRSNTSMLQKINRELQKEDVNENIKESLRNYQTKIEKDNLNILQKQFKGIDKLSENEKSTLINIDRKLQGLQNEVVDYLKDDTLDSKIKSLVLEDLDQQINKLVNQKYDIVNAGQIRLETEAIEAGAKNIFKGAVEVVRTKDIADTKEWLDKNADNYSSLRNQTEKDRIKRSEGTYGFIVEDKDTGRKAIVINEQESARGDKTATGRHEFLHALLASTIDTGVGKDIDLGFALVQEFKNQIKQGAELSDAFKTRINAYAKNNKISSADTLLNLETTDDLIKYMQDYLVGKDGKINTVQFEELLTLTSEALVTKDISLNENFITKLADLIRRFFKDLFNIDIRFDSGKDVLNFIKDYNASVDKGGKFSKRFEKLAEKGAEGKVFGKGAELIKEAKKTEVKESKSVKQQEKVKATLDNIGRDFDGSFNSFMFNPSDIRIANALPSMIEVQAGKYRAKGLQFDMDELVQETIVLLYEKGDINRFDGKVNNSLYGWLNKAIKFRILDAFAKNPAIVEDFSKKDMEGLTKEFSQEEADDITTQNERYRTEQATDITRKKQNLLTAIDIKVEIDEVVPYSDLIISALQRSVAINAGKYTEEVSKNVTVTPFVAAIKKDLGDDFYKTTKKFLNQYPGGYSGFLAEAKPAIFDSFTTTYLAKHPLFRKGIMKSSGGTMTKDNLGNDLFVPNWVAATKNAKGKWGWWDKNGDPLKIDRDNAGARGMTSGPEFIKRNPDINEIITTDEFIDYHYQDGPLRKKKKQNPEDALAKQISSELGFEVLANDLKTNGPITEKLKQVAGLYELAIEESEINNIVKDLDRGTVKDSAKEGQQMGEAIRQSTFIAVNEGGLYSDIFNNFVNRLPEDIREKIYEYWENRGEGNVEFLQDNKAFKLPGGNKGVTYEKLILDLFKSLNLPKESYKVITKDGAAFDATAPDIQIELFGSKINIEVKLNKQAQAGSFTNDLNPKFDEDGTIILDKGFTPEDLKKYTEGWKKFEEGYKEYSDTAKEVHKNWTNPNHKEYQKIYHDKYKSIENEIDFGFDKKGNRTSIVIPTELMQYLGAGKTNGKKNKNIQKNLAFDINDLTINGINYHYNSKDVYLMQIGKFGFVTLGKDINKLGQPILSGTAGISTRSVRGKVKSNGLRKLNIRSFHKFIDIRAIGIQEMHNLDKPGDLKKIFEPAIEAQGGKTMDSLKEDMDQLLERQTGISAKETVSAARAANIGKNKGRFKWFIPYNAEDFAGLLYPLLGKGKQGDADMEMLSNALLKTYNRAENRISSYKQQLARDFKVLTLELEKVKKDIDDATIKRIESIGFTTDQAIRVYIWTMLGYKIPNLTPKEQKSIVNAVKESPALLQYANGLMNITKVAAKYPEPSENWFADNVKSELFRFINTKVRSFYLEEWQANVDVIFSKENLNKMQAKFGYDYVDNLQKTIQRMKNGRSRPLNLNTAETKALDYINGSVGVIMFLNMRSAVLQTISAVNFLNWTDNNLVAVGKTFLQPKEFAKTFVEIMNSDFLKQRRAGLEINVEEAEIARAVERAKSKPKALFAELMKLGFKPTQIADSFAIAIGGTPFYMNRTKTYIKEGYAEDVAKKMAFEDFRALAEEHQQSSRQDRLSNIQTGLFGRLVFAFNNTPMQMTRLTKKAALDLINGRGDVKTNLSKLVYYGAVQNVIFYALQQALFAIALDDDEGEEKIDQRTERLANSLLDGFLRGSGLPGAALSTLKNILIEYAKQEDLGYKGDFNKVIISALGIMPPLSAKMQRAYSGYRTKKYFLHSKKGQQQLKEDDPNFLNDPIVKANAQQLAALTNIPADRLLSKMDNMMGLMDENLEPWRKTLLVLGWDKWSLGVYDKNKKEQKSTSRSQAIKDAWIKKKREQYIQDSKELIRSQENRKYLKYKKGNY